MLNGLNKPTSGDIFVNGINTKDEETETLLNTTNQQKAYDEWNAIKRPEKARKSM